MAVELAMQQWSARGTEAVPGTCTRSQAVVFD